MHRHWLRSIALAVLPAAALSGRALDSAGQAGPDGFVITRVRVFDGRRIRSAQNVVVRGDLIQAVGTDTSAWASLTKIDGAGATLLPGFLDAHTHTQEPAQLQQALRFGVTTVLDMFTGPAIEPALRRAAATRVDVADFRSAGILATAPGGHGTEYGIPMPTVSRTTDAAAFVRDRKAAGSDYLKIVLNGVRAIRDGIPTLDRPTTERLVRTAHSPDGFVKGSGTALADDSSLSAFLPDSVRARLTGPIQGPALDNIGRERCAMRTRSGLASSSL
jgi:cytosine/adenosine deaminase-related metal-dependent hydrolase